MQIQKSSAPEQEAATRALIDLIAEFAWAARTRGSSAPHRSRDEAMALLPRVASGDREAARRAIELVTAARAHAA